MPAEQQAEKESVDRLVGEFRSRYEGRYLFVRALNLWAVRSERDPKQWTVHRIIRNEVREAMTRLQGELVQKGRDLSEDAEMALRDLDHVEDVNELDGRR